MYSQSLPYVRSTIKAIECNEYLMTSDGPKYLRVQRNDKGLTHI